MKIFFLTLGLITLLVSCTNESSIITTVPSEETIAEGKKLMENKCYVCHSPKIAKAQLIAPPMIAIKEVYMASTEAEFIQRMRSFLDAPTIEKAKLPEAVQKHGLMPYQHYSPETIEAIAMYMFHSTIEKPSWWDEDESVASNEEMPNFGNDYSAKGLYIAQLTKQLLGKNLMGTIQREGTLAALKFCNIQAYPLTDSMAQHFNARITRISDRPRNPLNQASEDGLKHIEYYKNVLAKGKEAEPIVVTSSKDTRFYYPIETNQMCLQCHGKQSSISSDIRHSLRNLYPTDQATGYDVNEVRGVWEIIFSN